MTHTMDNPTDPTARETVAMTVVEERKTGGAIPDEHVYFLIAKFLESGPCKETSAALQRELTQHKVRTK